MTTQLLLLDTPAPDVETVASPICCRERCWRKGRAVLGEPVDMGGCVNRKITCLTCGVTGILSTRKGLAS